MPGVFDTRPPKKANHGQSRFDAVAFSAAPSEYTIGLAAGRDLAMRRLKMTLDGIVVNGMIVLNGNPQLPEGARVRVEVEEVFEYPHPLAPYDREKEVALLRERIAETSAGIPLK